MVVSILLTAGFVILASGFLRGSPLAREGMANPDEQMRLKAGLGKIDSPGYDSKEKPMFS